MQVEQLEFKLHYQQRPAGAASGTFHREAFLLLAWSPCDIPGFCSTALAFRTQFALCIAHIHWHVLTQRRPPLRTNMNFNEGIRRHCT
jgi:hypothetical protein